MKDDLPTTAFERLSTFWRRVLSGPSIAARIEIYEELAPSLTAGIGLREALHQAALRHHGRKRQTIERLADGVARDVAVSVTMRAHPESFTALESALLATGERTGRLDAAFRSAAAQLDRQRTTRNRLVQACAYPFVLLHCLILIPSLGILLPRHGVGGYLTFVVPALLALWGLLLAGISAAAAFSDRPGFARLVGRLPVVGQAVRAASIARFARSLSSLHAGGVTHGEALCVAAASSGNALVVADADRAIALLGAGGTFSAAIESMTFLQHEHRGLLIAGEQSGELEASALRVAEFADARFDVLSKRALAILPTVLVGLVGLAVAAIAFYVLSGYFKLLNDVMR